MTVILISWWIYDATGTCWRRSGFSVVTSKKQEFRQQQQSVSLTNVEEADAPQKQEEQFIELDPEYYSAHSPYEDEVFAQVLSLYEKAFLSGGQDESTVEEIIEYFVQLRCYKVYVLMAANEPKTVAAFAIISMLSENVDFCHLDYICVNENCRGKGTGSRFMTEYLIPTLHGMGKHVTLECETRLTSWYAKLGAKKLPILDSVFAGRRYVFMYFERKSGSNTADLETVISVALAEKVMGELRVKFHDLSVKNTVQTDDDAYCTWE